jgi:hypothetical protein
MGWGIPYEDIGGVKMKIEIYDETKPAENILRLKLVPGLSYDTVILQAVDENGLCRGSLLSIMSDGSLKLHSPISRNLGLKLDYKCRVEISK